MLITKEDYEQARKSKDESEAVIHQYHLEQQDAFAARLKENPIFADAELFYSATTLCPCGHGLAYPKNCGAGHYWDCSAILRGIADANVDHTDQLPFAFYEIKGEREGATTRGVFKPKN